MGAKAFLARAAGPLLLPASLATFFKRSPPTAWGMDSLRRALATREQRFLEMTRAEIYGRPRSPYARLLRHAGCTYGDLVALIRAEGLETALVRLAEQGVRLSEAEFRRRTDVNRPGLSFRIRADDLLPARFDLGLLANSSGNGGSPLPCLYPLEWMKLEACMVEAFVGAHGVREHVHATDDGRLTGGAGVKFMLYLGRHGIGCARWFVRETPLEGGWLRAYHGIVAGELAFMGSRFGRGFARPTVATDEEVLAWIDRERHAGRRCCIRTVVSRAIDIARVAAAAGRGLDDTVFIASGEPLTAARRGMIEHTGARVIPHYGFVPGGLLGVGCALPDAPDDMHLMAHTLAVVGAPETTEPRRRLLVTSLHARAPSIQLNVENGDLAEISDRDCGCLLGQAGLRRHLSNVGSDRQLTLRGMNYAIEDLIDLMERTLPTVCGGTIGDYQLVEEHGTDGRGYLSLRVHPRLESRDTGLLIEQLRRGLASGSRGKRLMTNVWDQAGALRVVRQAPAASPRGKVPAVLTLSSHLREKTERAATSAP